MNNSEYFAKFITTLPEEFKITNNEITLQGSMTKLELSQLVIQLLEAENPEQEYTQNFDFLVNGLILRTTLHELIETNEISTETALQIEYVFAIPEPKLKHTTNMNDWIIAISSNNNHIITALSNGDIAICSEKGKILKTHKTKIAKSFTFFADIVISTHWDCTVQIFKINELNLQLIGSAKLPSYGECSAINQKELNQFAVGTANGELLFFEIDGNLTNHPQVLEIKENFKVHSQQITCCQWIRANTIVTGSYDHSIVFLNKKTGTITKQLFAKDSTIHSLHYFPLSQQIISSHEDGYLKLWDSQSEQLIKVFKSSLIQLTQLAVSPNNQIIVCSMDGNAYLWDIRGEVPLYQLNGQGKQLACTFINNKIIFGGSANKMYIYE